MQWIKVSEQLPPYGTEVLFFDGTWMVIVYFCDSGKFSSNGYFCNDRECSWIYDDCGCDLKVTDDCYWMFMPPEPEK